MSSVSHGLFREKIRFLKRHFLQDDGLPLTDVLSREYITNALAVNSTN